MTRAHKRYVDHASLREHWREQAAELGFDARGLAADAIERCPVKATGAQASLPGIEKEDTAHARTVAEQAVGWAVSHLSEREAVFSRTNLLTAALTWKPGAVSIDDAWTRSADWKRTARCTQRTSPSRRLPDHRQGGGR